ncbi:MAG: aspartate 1-decarboxylase [Candidatus Aminicenantaceae bacterium]
MRRTMLKSKVHNARVTETNLDYQGSLTLDETLMKEAAMAPYEQIHVYNISNGERFITYLIKGERDSGTVGVNGAAARKAKVGDRLIIASYGIMEEEELELYMPRILIVDENNRIQEAKS